MIDKIKRYYELKEQERIIKEEKDMLNQEIKKWMISNVRKDNIIIDGYNIKITFIDLRKFDDSIIPFLKMNGFENLIETKEVFDYEKLKRLIKIGKIDVDDINRYRSNKGKQSINLYVTEVKNV